MGLQLVIAGKQTTDHPQVVLMCKSGPAMLEMREMRVSWYSFRSDLHIVSAHVKTALVFVTGPRRRQGIDGWIDDAFEFVCCELLSIELP
jgi:hypothetical protein